MPLSRKSKWLICLGTVLVAIALCAQYVVTHPLVFNESFLEHAHCIGAAGLILITYAKDHDKKFPYHERGYGDALLLVPGENFYCFTGAGYDEQVFHTARQTGGDVPESQCGRVYVQGLSLGDSRLVILFDKLPTPGGDHCHLWSRFFAPLGREVLYTDMSHQFIPNSKWPEFAKQQIELLTEAGITRDEAERLYAE